MLLVGNCVGWCLPGSSLVFSPVASFSQRSPRLAARTGWRLSAPHQSLRYIYCNTINGSISDHYDLWTDNVNWGSSSTANWNIAMQVHYRINSDCSFKGYFVNAQNQGGGCGSPCYNPYIVSPALYNGYNSIFDSAPMGCLNIGSATGYFSQYSNSSAVIYMSTEWHPRSGCSGYPLTWLNHYFTYQP